MEYTLISLCFLLILQYGATQFNNQQGNMQPTSNQQQPGTFTNQNMGQPQNPSMQPVPNQFNPGSTGTGQQQPGTFNTGTGQQQPGTFNTGTGQQQPGTFNTGTGQQQPGTLNTATGQQQPTAVNQAQPGSPGAQAPGVSAQDVSQFTCAQAGRAAVAQCFLQNGGFQMINVIALLSNGTQGQMPPNSQQIKATLCQQESAINSCVFKSIMQYNNTQQCSTQGAFIRLQQETVGLLNGIQQMCGTGILPSVTMCMRRLSYDMMQCYQKVGLNPSLYAPGGSRLEGAVIGDNREAAKMFCQKREAFFNCQNQVLENCPNASDLQEISGNDQASMQLGMEVLCKDIDDYVSGLVCFQQPTPEVQTCATELVSGMTDLTMRQIRDSLTKNEFFTEYCLTRVKNLRCDRTAWGKVCKNVAVGLKSEFQCALLPSKCKQDPQVRGLYQQVCSEKHYARSLRVTSGKPNPDQSVTPGNGGTSTIVGISSVSISVVISLFFLL